MFVASMGYVSVYAGVTYDGKNMNMHSNCFVCECLCPFVHVYVGSHHIPEIRFSSLAHKSGLPSFLSFRLYCWQSCVSKFPQTPTQNGKRRPGQLVLVPLGIWKICSNLLKAFLKVDWDHQLGLQKPMFIWSIDTVVSWF